ncbi:MAG: thioredoxin domain-containing protein [Pyrinomonadaceae bacterium]
MQNDYDIVRLVRPVDESDHVRGAVTSAATLVEYGDYECPHCQALHPIMQELIKRSDGLRFVYRHFPLSKFHPHAARAAQAAEAAAAQGRFWEMHDLLFKQTQPLDDDRLTKLARKAGLDLDRYRQEMADGIYTARIDEAYNSALFGGGVTGTPTIYLNEVQISRVHNLEELCDVVTAAGATLTSESAEKPSWLSKFRSSKFGRTANSA